MTTQNAQQRRTGTGVFIPACMLQDSATPTDVSPGDDSQTCPNEHSMERRSFSSRRSVESSASSRRSLSFTRGTSPFAPGSTQLPSPLPASDDTLASKMYQQSALYSPSAAPPTVPTAPRPPASSANAANRTSRRCSVDSTAALRRTARRYSVDSTSLQQWANSTMSTSSVSSANNSSSASPFQSALYAPSGSTSPAMPTAPRAPAHMRNGSATRRISVDLHNMRAAGISVGGLSPVGAASPAAAGGMMASPQGVNAAQFVRPGRCSFDVGSRTVGCFSAPMPAAAAGAYMLQNPSAMVASSSNGMLNSQDLCYDSLQLQQQDSMMSMSQHMTSSPIATAEQALDSQIHTVLMDILHLGSQLAAAADAAGVGAVPANPHGRFSMDQQTPLIPFFDENLALSPNEVNAVALQQQQQQQTITPAMQIGLAPVTAAMGPAGSPRNSLDVLLLQQQQQQQVLPAADAASMTALGMASAAVGPAFPSLELDVIEEDAADATAYFVRHQQQKVKHHQFIPVAGGTGSPVFSSSPPTAAVVGPNCGAMTSAGLCNQIGDELSGYTPSLSPEAQAKLQELMAAQQLQLEIQNELLAMLTTA